MSMRSEEEALLTIQETGEERTTNVMGSVSSYSRKSSRTKDEFWEHVPGVEMHFKCNAANRNLVPELRELLVVWSDMLGSTYILSAAAWNGASLSVTSIRHRGFSRYTKKLIRCRRRFGEPRITWGGTYELEITKSKDKLIWSPLYEVKKPFYWLRRYQCDRSDIDFIPRGKTHMRHPYSFGKTFAKQYKKCGSWPKTRKEIRLISRKQKELTAARLSEPVSKVLRPMRDAPTNNEQVDIHQGPMKERPIISTTSVMTAVRRSHSAWRLSMTTSVHAGADVIYENTPRTEFDDGVGCDLPRTFGHPTILGPRG